MRVINLIVVHCSATKADRDFTEQDLEVCHRRRGMNGPGYHFYIRKNGDIKTTRPIEKIGVHARGHNAQSIGICYEGGISERGRLADTRTVWQKHSLRVLVRALLVDYPGCKVCGHRDLSPDLNGNAVKVRRKCYRSLRQRCYDEIYKNTQKRVYSKCRITKSFLGWGTIDVQ